MNGFPRDDRKMYCISGNVLGLHRILSHPDESLKKIGECVGRSTLKQLNLLSFSPSFLSEEVVKEWVQSVVVGGNSLLRSLEYSQINYLSIVIVFTNVSCPINKDGIQAQFHSSLKETLTIVNLLRERKKSLPYLEFNITFY